MKLYTTCFLVILTISATAQSYRWERIIGIPNRGEGLSDLKEHYDKGYYLDAGHWPLGSWGSTGWPVKTDVNGAVLWDKTLMGVYEYEYNSWEVISDEDGNTYVAGTMLSQQGRWHPLVAKFNACGEKVWCRVLDDLNSLYGGAAFDIVLNQNNQLIVLLEQLFPWTVDAMYLAAFSLDGDFLWRNVIASNANHNVMGANFYSMLYHNNAYYFTGIGYYPKPGNPYRWFMRHLFVGLDSLFEEKFILPFDYQGTALYGRSIISIPLNDTVLMAVGVDRIELQGVLVFYDINGNEIGHCMIDCSNLSPGILSSQLFNIVHSDDSLFIASGLYEPQRHMFRNFEVVLDTLCLLYNFVVRPNANSWAQLITTSDGNFMMGTNRRLVPTGPRDILLAKFDKNLQPVPFDTATYVYDTLCPYPIQSGNIDMSACMVIIVGEGDIPTSREYNARISTIPIRVFPNPAHDNITFALENTGHHSNIELRCFNLLGVLQYQTRVQRGQQQTTADVSSWPPGMYIVVTYSNGKPVGREKFVVRR